jgi:hypothetical protein
LLTGSDVQWQFVHGLYEFAIYGGRVDNTFDLRVLVSYLKQFFDGSVLSNQILRHIVPCSISYSTHKLMQYDILLGIIVLNISAITL